MRALTRPKPEYTYDAGQEIERLVAYRDKEYEDPARSRQIPAAGTAGHVLLATWNVANLGVHERRPPDLEVIAEILSWFEIVAIQEVADNLDDFLGVMDRLPGHFAWVFSDRAGNDELQVSAP